MRKTKIICTIGPASQEEDILRKIILAGMNVARFNFSHGDHEEHGRKLERVRRISRELNLPVAVLLDTRGPEIRLRDFEGGKTELKSGQKFTLTTEEIMGTNERATITYKNLPGDVKPGDSILLDDGLIGLKVEEVVNGTEIVCTVMNGGPISNHKGVNVPGVKLNLPFIDDKDRADIIYACEKGFDFIAASFVRSKEDVLEIREILKQYNSKIQIISKIESQQGIQNLEEIIEVSDGIMVARGDMGVEIPMEEVPIVQKRIIKLTVAAGKNVITATQMLDSMIHHPRPTRAEATDVANAIYDGTTGIMLSGETANGDYPLEALQAMVRIAERAEQDIDYIGRMRKAGLALLNQPQDITTSICHATCTIATDLNAAAIIPVSMSGFTSSMVARFKPTCPIIACTTSRLVWRQMNLQWGVSPLLIAEENTQEDLFREAVNAALEAGYVKKGDKVVLTAGMPLGISGKTNMLRIVEV
ncbi:MAG: pyruvate kinase [Eubacteriales bacterium]|nr:pyruvate kinase [Eubacteriales bacterium]